MPASLEDLKAALAGRYEIDREIGQGGMATVYLADDVRHQRKVAVKVLRPDLAAALGGERFLREIRIAANLTHPHILPLHDSGEADGFLYYVMPYIEGDTLRERIEKEGELPVGESVRIIREVVDALAFAHSQGVVHRDIKPDNVMLSGRHAMVMDFGVAKAVSEATGRSTLTTAGVALGTPTYMAPEQATADPNVDHRADIYAVGVMAYELLAGRTPFQGASPQAVLAAHVTEAADPVSKHRDHVSGDLEALVMKCLAKKPADRWQSAEEMMPHLEAMAATSGGLTPTSTRPIEGLAGPRRRVWWMAAGAAAVIVIAVVGSRMLQPASFAITVSNDRQITSDIGLESQPALSPDGEKVVYTKGGPYRSHPYVKVLMTETSLRLGENLQGYQRTPRWTADGNSVTFVQSLFDGEPTLRSTSMLGGAITTIDIPIHRIAFGLSPDGTMVVYDSLVDGSWSILLRPLAGGAATVLVNFTPSDAPNETMPHSFAWSPDGLRIAYVIGNGSWVGAAPGNVGSSRVWAVDVAGGPPVPVTTGEHLNQSPQWLPDSRHVLFVSNRDVRRGIYLAEVAEDGSVGEPSRLAGGSNPHTISLSADGRRLAYTNFDYARNVYAYAIPESGTIAMSGGVRITAGTEVIEGIAVSPDGEWLAFDSHVNGNQDIFKVRLADGHERTQLTYDPRDDFIGGGWSPDGTELAYGRGETDGLKGRLVSADGARDMDLFGGRYGDTWAASFWSPSELELGIVSSQWEIWVSSRERVDGDWGEPVQLTDDCGFSSWSPTGDHISCSWLGGIKLLSRSGSLLWHMEPDLEAGVPRMTAPRFSADGSTVYVQGRDADGIPGVWAVPTAGGPPRMVIESDDPSVWPYPASLEVAGDRIYLSVGEYESDVWVMDLEY